MATRVIAHLPQRLIISKPRYPSLGLCSAAAAAAAANWAMDDIITLRK